MKAWGNTSRRSEALRLDEKSDDTCDESDNSPRRDQKSRVYWVAARSASYCDQTERCAHLDKNLRRNFKQEPAETGEEAED